MAGQACEIEINRLGEPIGKQDQYACAFGGVNYLRFNTDGSVAVEKICLTRDQLYRLESNLLLFYTGVTRSAGDILREQREGTRVMPAKSVLLMEMVSLAETLHKELCGGNVDAVGEIMHEGWMRKRQLAGGISSMENGLS